MRFVLPLLVVVVLSACGGSPCDSAKCLAGQTCDASSGLCVGGSDGQAKNGSRLHLRVMKGDDGSQLQAGLFDMLRHEDCGYTLAEDGATRCLPTSFTFFEYFADANCTVGLVRTTSSSCGTPAAYGDVQQFTCGARRAVYPLSPIAAPAAIFSNAGGTCVQQPNVVAATQWYQAGTKLPASLFVAGTLE
jgi:hypothetical protein